MAVTSDCGQMYFSIPVSCELEAGSRDVLEAGELAYWPPGRAFCIFFGPTPASQGDDIRAASAVNIVGRLKGDVSALWNVPDVSPVSIERAECGIQYPVSGIDPHILLDKGGRIWYIQYKVMCWIPDSRYSIPDFREHRASHNLASNFVFFVKEVSMSGKCKNQTSKIKTAESRRAGTAFCILILCVLGAAARAELVGWWAFEEGAGTDILDSSGYGNHGTVHDNVQWSEGKIGLALEFAGADGHCEIPFSESLKILNQGDFTIAAWMLLNTVPPSTNRLLLQQLDLNGTGRSLLFVHTSNEIRSFAGGAATGSGVAMEAGEWYHAAVVVTEQGATDSIQMYVNGEAAGAANTTLGMEDCEGLYHIGSHKNPANNVWDGRIDDLRIYNHALSDSEMIAAMHGTSGGFPLAYRPDPADGAFHAANWVTLSFSPGDSAVSHDVYMGTSFDDVEAGAGDTFLGNQTATSVIAGFPGFPYPTGLEAGTTYYWRIDEVNEADPNSPWKGDVWSFMVPPKTAYAPDPIDGAEFVDPNAELSWTPGFGAMLHTVYIGTSFDDVNNASGGLAQGAATFSPGPLEFEKVYYWRVDEFDATATYKGNIWAFTTPDAAGDPHPADGAVDTVQTQTLTWTPAANAASHDLYFGQDKDALARATKDSPEFKGNKVTGAESYDAGKLAWDSTYYWRVDAVYDAETIKGLPWTFTTADFLLIDDFESYNDIDPPDANSNRIFEAWADGFGVATNGALVGNDLPPYAEQGVIRGGDQSMPYSYDNNMMISEATKKLVSPRDWAEAGVTKLSLWFRGSSANAAEPMFVALNGSAVVYHEDPGATQIGIWTEWVIDLQAFADLGVNLADVDTITIGFGTKNAPAAGGAGKMYFDEIRLYR